jgi:hypothetical protein
MENEVDQVPIRVFVSKAMHQKWRKKVTDTTGSKHGGTEIMFQLVKMYVNGEITIDYPKPEQND